MDALHDAVTSQSEPTAPRPEDVNGHVQRARVLYDYDAADLSELSLAADEVSSHRLFVILFTKVLGHCIDFSDHQRLPS